MTPWIDQTLYQFANVLPNWTLLTILTLLPNFGGFHRTLQQVRLASRVRLLLRTPGPVPFGTCICSNVETILSWPFEFRTSLGTSILLLNFKNNMKLWQGKYDTDFSGIRIEEGGNKSMLFMWNDKLWKNMRGSSAHCMWWGKYLQYIKWQLT